MTENSSHAEQAAARFDDWADRYGEDRISPWFAHYQTKALSMLNLRHDTNFLDVGCGVGKAVGQAALEIGEGKACGIDISPKMIEKARMLNPDDRRTDFRVADSESIPFEDNYFDSILCTFSFHHYLHPIRVLKDICRVLRPGGRFVLIDSARDTSFAIWLQDRGRRYLERSHVRYYTVAELKNMLKKTDLRLTEEITTVTKFMDHGKTFTGLMIAQCSKDERPAYSTEEAGR